MAKWDEGYVTDVAYTSNFYREITPAWLAATSLLLGHRSPDLDKPFSYADLGCGNGFTTLVIAATSPHADVWGFDFNPAHVEFATRLAERAGLTNVRFVESSFAGLHTARDGVWPDFDFMVSHGVLSWISPENRQHLIGAVTKRLKPGGLVYLSYNVTTGWSAMVPVRRVMRMLARASPERTDIAVPGVLDFVDRLKGAGALFFQAHPNLESRLAEIRKQDARYIAHEYLNEDWNPLMFADVAGEMLEAKCRYIGSATLPENIDAVSVSANVAPLLAETRDPVLRETLRDIGCAQSFRRDLYRKGGVPMPGAGAADAAARTDDRRSRRDDAGSGSHFCHASGQCHGAPRDLPAAVVHAGARPVKRRAGTPIACFRRAPAGGNAAGVQPVDCRRLRPSDPAVRRHCRRT